MEMRTKNLLGFFLTIACVLFLATSVSAANGFTSGEKVTVNGINTAYDVSVVAGETITVKVYFTANVSDTDVRVEAELEGDKVDVDAVSEIFDVEKGQRYKKVLTLKVPYELKDQRNDTVILAIEIDGAEHKTELDDIILRVQRPSYNADIMSINTEQSVEAGDTFPVDVVLKNIGYNDLDDLYVTAKIPALNVEKRSYVGDLIAVENGDNDDDDDDTLRVRFYLRTPYDAQAGIYALEVEVRNDDLTMSDVIQITVDNDFTSNVIVADHSKTLNVGERASYELLIINPTNKLKVYRIVTESSGSLSTSASEEVVAVPAGLSKSIRIFATADARGDHNFDVNVFSGEELVGSVTLSANVEGGTVANAIVALTIILVIVFIVLLIVLVVLLRKKPEQTEEFGESYY